MSDDPHGDPIVALLIWLARALWLAFMADPMAGGWE